MFIKMGIGAQVCVRDGCRVKKCKIVTIGGISVKSMDIGQSVTRMDIKAQSVNYVV